MTPAEITAGISLATAIAAGAGAWTAYVKSNRMTESQVIEVTAKTAKDVVSLVNVQLDRSMTDFQRLSERVEALEEALTKERGKNMSLQLQLGMVRKRVKTLEEFIHSKGFTPPPHVEDE
jgi:enoyl-[acyl-carrier-protein] reductase (NADH)